MSVVIGLVTDNQIIMGADQQTTRDNALAMTDGFPKVFVNGEMIFGCVGSPRVGQLLRFNLVAPRHYPEIDTDSYMASVFMQAVRDCFKDHGYTNYNEGQEEGATFMVGYQGQLYEVGVDFALSMRRDGLSAVGCGSYYALGAMHALADRPPAERIQRSLEIVARLDPHVSEPFVFEAIQTPGRYIFGF